MCEIAWLHGHVYTYVWLRPLSVYELYIPFDLPFTQCVAQRTIISNYKYFLQIFGSGTDPLSPSISICCCSICRL